MVTAGCTALHIQTDNPACEAQDNYRGVGGDDSSLFLPCPQIFGCLEARPGGERWWRLLWQQQLTEHSSVPLSSGAGTAGAAGCHGAASCIPWVLHSPGCAGLPGSGTGKTRLRWWFSLGGEDLDTGEDRTGKERKTCETLRWW